MTALRIYTIFASETYAFDDSYKGSIVFHIERFVFVDRSEDLQHSVSETYGFDNRYMDLISCPIESLGFR